MKKIIYIFLITSLVNLTNCNQVDPNIVATINSEIITRAELDHWMLLEKATIYSYFYRKYGAQKSEHFWTEKQGGEVPLELLKNTALENVKQCKIQQILALDKGIISTTNFDEIMKKLDGVNAERLRKVKNGEPIYGPKQFTSRTYFLHVFDTMVIALKNELAKDELKPNEDQLNLIKVKINGSEKENIGFLKMQYVDRNYEAYIKDISMKTRVIINEKVYRTIRIN